MLNAVMIATAQQKYIIPVGSINQITKYADGLTAAGAIGIKSGCGKPATSVFLNYATAYRTAYIFYDTCNSAMYIYNPKTGSVEQLSGGSSSFNFDSAFATKTTDNLLEGANHFYFTVARARAVISVTTIGTSGPSSYNNVTGVLNVPQYTGGSGGETDPLSVHISDSAAMLLPYVRKAELPPNTKRIQSISSAATVTPNALTDDAVKITALAVNVTINAPSGTPSPMQELIFRIKDNGSAARTITWDAIYRTSTDLPLPGLTTVARTIYLKFIYNSDDTRWDLIGLINNF